MSFTMHRFHGIYPVEKKSFEADFLSQNNFTVEQKGILFKKNKTKNIYVSDARENYYIYRVTGGDFDVYGLVGLIPHQHFNSMILPHEQILTDKVLKLSKALLEFRMQMNPVLLFYRNNNALTDLLKSAKLNAVPHFETSISGVKHEISSIKNSELLCALQPLLLNMQRLYVADGHHRIQASLSAAQRDKKVPPFCLGMLIAADALHISSINRCLKQEIPVNAAYLIARIKQYFDITDGYAVDRIKHKYGLYLRGQWYTLHFKNIFLAQMHMGEQLDPCVVDNCLIKFIFSIQDQRFEQKLRFIPDPHELELRNAIASGAVDVAICMPPISMDELCLVAENRYAIPPHSTYLQPKALDGIISWEY